MYTSLREYLDNKGPTLPPGVETISATEARAQLPSIMRYVGETDRPVAITNHGRPVAAFISIKKFKELERFYFLVVISNLKDAGQLSNKDVKALGISSKLLTDVSKLLKDMAEPERRQLELRANAWAAIPEKAPT